MTSSESTSPFHGQSKFFSFFNKDTCLSNKFYFLSSQTILGILNHRDPPVILWIFSFLHSVVVKEIKSGFVKLMMQKHQTATAMNFIR